MTDFLPVQTSEPVLTTVADLLSPDHYALQAHPLVPLPSASEAEAFLARSGGDLELTKLLNDRGQLIWLMEQDPARYGAELEHWQEADAVLRLYNLIYIAGGKRAAKSEWAAKRFVESCVAYGDSLRWAFQDNERTSIATQQKLIWKYLPPELKQLNQKRNPVYKVNYTPAGGFADRILVLPNRTEIHFLTYNQETTDFQGWEIGARLRKPVLAADGRRVENIGAWADEDLPLKWLETIKYRLSTRQAKMLWTFSTTEGITNTIRDFLGTPKTVKTKAAELLPDRINVPGVPAGEMPFVQEPTTPNAAVIYFFTQWNPFSGYDQPGGVKELCHGRPSDYVMENAYGYSKRQRTNAFPKFGEWNIIKPEHLPEEGTNYMCCDPAGKRNWATIWLRVAPGNPSSVYIYRDWPDARRFGEWAVTSANPHRQDGDAGPAQPTLGYGPTEYKALFLREERITGSPEERDPYRIRLWREAQSLGLDGARIEERIRQRLIDPRAGRNQHAVDKGGVCLTDKLAEVNRDKDGKVLAPALHFEPARGLDIEDGVSQIQTLLYWDTDQALMPLLNYPRLFVADHCRQVIWALQNWTGQDGQEGACKDFVDALRYLVTWDVRHIAAGKVKTSGGGTY